MSDAPEELLGDGERDLKRKAKLMIYDAAIETACRKFKNKRACNETFDAMCEWAQRWLARRKHRALVSWSGVAGKSVSFQITDLSRIEEMEVSGTVEF